MKVGTNTQNRSYSLCLRKVHPAFLPQNSHFFCYPLFQGTIYSKMTFINLKALVTSWQCLEEVHSSPIFAVIMYRILRSILFCFSPEWVHYFSMNCLKLLCTIGFKKIITGLFKPKINIPASITFGKNTIQFANPVGLGAGFDKNAKYLRELECLGFGFVEIGTVTHCPRLEMINPVYFVYQKTKPLLTGWVLIMMA